MTKRIVAVAGAIVALSIVRPVSIGAQQNVAPVPVPPPPGTAGAPMNGVDRRFAVVAMQSGAAEIEESSLILTRSESTDIAGFARKMLDEHRAIDASFGTRLARAMGSATAPKYSEADALALVQLRALPAVDAAQAYVLDQVGGHLATLTAFQAEAAHGSDATLVALAKKWMPTIASHLQDAVDLAKHATGDSPLR